MKRDASSLIQIEQRDRHIEIRYFQKPHDTRYFCWKLPTQEATDLTRWWNKGGRHLRAEDLPMTDCRCGSVTVSANVMNRIEVRSLDSRGRPRMIGYSLPRDAVAALAEKLDGREFSRSSAGKKEPR